MVDDISDGTESSIPKFAESAQGKEMPELNAFIDVVTSSTSGETIAISNYVVKRKNNNSATFVVDAKEDAAKEQQTLLSKMLKEAFG